MPHDQTTTGSSPARSSRPGSDDLQLLADRITASGEMIAAQVRHPPGYPPYLRVTVLTPGAHRSEDITHLDDLFYWPWGQPIDGRDHDEVARVIVDALTRTP